MSSWNANSLINVLYKSTMSCIDSGVTKKEHYIAEGGILEFQFTDKRHLEFREQFSRCGILQPSPVYLSIMSCIDSGVAVKRHFQNLEVNWWTGPGCKIQLLSGEFVLHDIVLFPNSDLEFIQDLVYRWTGVQGQEAVDWWIRDATFWSRSKCDHLYYYSLFFFRHTRVYARHCWWVDWAERYHILVNFGR